MTDADKIAEDLRIARVCLEGAIAAVHALHAECADLRAAIKRAAEEERERILTMIDRMDESGHCGEDTSEKISRQRRNHVREEIAAAIRGKES